MGLRSGRKADGRLRTTVKPEALNILVSGTRGFLLQPPEALVAVREVDSLSGHWGSRFTLNRDRFAIFDQVYVWLQRHRTQKQGRMWPGMRSEFRGATALSPALFVEQDLDWSREAFSVDAPRPGFATCTTLCSRQELVNEGRWAEQKGWSLAPHPAGDREECGQRSDLEEEFPSPALSSLQASLKQDRIEWRSGSWSRPAGLVPWS